MSDAELRRLERLLSQDNENYAVWEQYIQVGARTFAYDPNNWNSFVSWISHEARPAVAAEPYDYDASMRWSAAEDRANLLLHCVRNTVVQLPASALASKIDQFFSQLYRKPRKIEVILGDDYGYPFNIVIIDDTYRVTYNEQHVVENNRLIQRSLASSNRSILDASPQYLIEVDVAHPGMQTALRSCEDDLFSFQSTPKTPIAKTLSNFFFFFRRKITASRDSETRCPGY